MAGDGGPPVCFIVCAFSIHFITDSSFLGSNIISCVSFGTLCE